ncbi:phosphatidylcholine transfer protein-like [Sinocyclocheilus grahami]|uniref:phosphatidylcholine transfer protein-like n=1 Tax=Sinocyclocheilus grahami TaxID=75366 RepID=UPI0007ACE5DB|nr:PREDICTED: phosphatidylcholine transfer protein-like [Sinocyclocheilus grahami]
MHERMSTWFAVSCALTSAAPAVGHVTGGRSSMALLFSDEEIQQAWTELDEPQLDGGWELFTETMNVKIYRLYNKETGLYEYKVFGSLTGCAPDLCADVYMDLSYRRQWDSYVKVPPVAGGQIQSDIAELHEKDYGGQKAIYWEVKYPLPLSNRDVSYKHTSCSDKYSVCAGIDRFM